MKIVQDTPTILEVKERSDFAVIIVGVVLIALGIYIFAVSGEFLALIFLGFGIVIMFFAKTAATVRADKPAQKLYITRKTLLGKKGFEYDFAQIAAIELRHILRRDQKGRMIRDIQIVCVLKSFDEEILFYKTLYQRGLVATGGASGDEAMMGKYLAQFIGVPFKEVEPTELSLGDIVSKVAEGIQRAKDKKGGSPSPPSSPPLPLASPPTSPLGSPPITPPSQPAG